MSSYSQSRLAAGKHPHHVPRGRQPLRPVDPAIYEMNGARPSDHLKIMVSIDPEPLDAQQLYLSSSGSSHTACFPEMHKFVFPTMETYYQLLHIRITYFPHISLSFSSIFLLL